MHPIPTSLSDLQHDRASGLSYRLRQPVAAQPTACVVLLHGVGSNEQDLAALAAPWPAEWLVVLGRGQYQLGPNMYAWFQVNFTANGPIVALDQAEDSRQKLISLLGHVQSQHGIAANKTVIAGFSQGGVMSASVGLTEPEKIGGFALLSGRILPELAPQIAAPARLAPLRAFIGHGEYDSKLPVSWAQQADHQLSELGIAHTTRLYPIEHTISPAMYADFSQWLKETLG